MQSKSPLLRTIVEELVVSMTLDACTFPRVRDAFDGLTWRLAKNPKDGYEFAPDLRVAKIQSKHGAPAIALVYSFDVNQIVILGIRIDAASGAPAVRQLPSRA